MYARPHPGSAKAADGKLLHRLEPDPLAAPVVRRIFTEYVAGWGIFAIAEALTRDDIASPSAHNRSRNPHRSGIAWFKGAIRTILANSRYTGRQVWNKQRKDEALVDVDDVALGHVSKIRRNDPGKGLVDTVVHEPLTTPARRARQHVMAAKEWTATPANDTAPALVRTARLAVLRAVWTADAGQRARERCTTGAGSPPSTAWRTASSGQGPARGRRASGVVMSTSHVDTFDQSGLRR
ncbi:recombinase family protein [Actinoalloteichus fjordicus]|uniref:Recombinase n=1 Tax=Actinoalloteichus fjordicus TaxID=1612552 RepID=A0AAC9PSN1_9PSEU|nr:recombinase family protein [Actinoalloteichus fjordicus]APU15308.1 Recombinase [Actinoalloteichus fjordicus]